MKSPISILESIFGFGEFKDNQEAIISNVLSGRDTLALMPTGGGKSLCYQIPALAKDGVAIVISPLIALMKDQVDALRANGISAEYLNSTLSQEMEEEVIWKLKNNQLDLLYLAPERLFSRGGGFLEMLKSVNINLFAIDEAHCISQWGHDFRPEYRQLSVLKNEFDEIPIIALTATADERTKNDIINKLKLDDAKVFVSSFNRENIHYFIEAKQNTFDKLVNYLEKHKNESGIIYTLSRASSENLAQRLADLGYSAKPYNAGLSQELRRKNQEDFVRDKVKIIVATVAFGMGIDKSNVRFVVHTDLPKNIEAYYQETGRAGRDGLKSEALLFYSAADVMKLQNFIKIDGNQEQSKIMSEKLKLLQRYCETKKCRRQMLLNYFGEEHGGNCGSCDFCLTETEYFDGTIIAQKALSAVYRLDQSFGMNYVIDFLRGSKSEKIKPWHKNLKTYGVGKDISKKQWQEYLRDLISEKYLEISVGQYPLLLLTQKSMEVLKGEEKVKLIKSEIQSIIVEQEYDYQIDLFDELRKLRRSLAEEENIAPYMIFSDKSLIELATFLPRNSEEVSRISGFGSVKIKKYADDFLSIVNDFMKENNLESQIHLKKKRRIKGKKQSSKTNTIITTLDLYNSDKSIEEIASARELSERTIENHIAQLIELSDINLSDLLDENRINTIQKVIKKIGGTTLTPFKNELGDDYSFAEIKYVLASLEEN